VFNIINFDLNKIIEFEYIDYKDEKFFEKGFFSPVKFGKNKFILVIIQDITATKLADNIIKDEYKRLKELDKVKKQMTAETTEELKSPLHIMSNAAELLLNLYKDKLDTKAIELLEMIQRGGERSMDLVGKMIDISRIESQEFKLEKQTESLIEIIRDSVDEVMAQQMQDFFINFDVLEDLYAEVDKKRIRQVIKDLLLTVMENTPKKSKIRISLQKNGKYAKISIKNIFEETFTGEETEQILDSQESLFGFHYSKVIVEMHGGQVTTQSMGRDRGSAFNITLPIKKWSDLLIHLYIIYKSGLLIYDHSFIGKENQDSSLISGGIVGTLIMLKEIIHGETQIRTIDHGDRKLMFETNKTEDIIFVLLVKENLIVFKRRLDALIERFDIAYKDLIDDIENTSLIMNYWENLDDLINDYFKE
ncbi:MAG: sensor histidine kinase, partial [Promethearchaeota archaeon]